VRFVRRAILILWVVACGLVTSPATYASPQARDAEDVLRTWYRLVLELTRHTPTYSPPVASRSFSYIGIAAYEAVASGHTNLASFSGQIATLPIMPKREHGQIYDERIVLHATMTLMVRDLFSNTGPTGQRVIDRLESRLNETIVPSADPASVLRSRAHGEAVARAVLAWSLSDGGAVVENMGFPLAYTLTPGPARWVPTSALRQQQFPLLPTWGKNRTFALKNGAACPLPAPVAYSEDKGSDLYQQAAEVRDTVMKLTKEQRLIARFWSDDPMLSPTPPGHWVSIALQLLEEDDADLARSADVLARLGIVLADSFIANWHVKYEHDLLRPVTYIKRVIDPKWEPVLITPPFPEYPSGHSTQSGAAADVLAQLFGKDRAFVDATHEKDGLAPRSFVNFHAAAQEAALSRLYGGIHFRPAIEQGLVQGQCVASAVKALKTVQ
jgi:hypothetical protein